MTTILLLSPTYCLEFAKKKKKNQANQLRIALRELCSIFSFRCSPLKPLYISNIANFFKMLVSGPSDPLPCKNGLMLSKKKKKKKVSWEIVPHSMTRQLVIITKMKIISSPCNSSNAMHRMTRTKSLKIYNHFKLQRGFPQASL